MMTRPGGRSNRSVAPADSAGVACGAAAPRGPTRRSRGSRRIHRERCSEGASCCDGDGCSRASVRAPQRRSRRARACRGRLGAPPARAGARGRAWAGQISRADAFERTARLAGTQQPRQSCAGRRSESAPGASASASQPAPAKTGGASVRRAVCLVPLAALALLLALLSGVLSCALRRARLGSARSRARFLEIVTALRIPRARKPALFFI